MSSQLVEEDSNTSKTDVSKIGHVYMPRLHFRNPFDILIHLEKQPKADHSEMREKNRCWMSELQQQRAKVHRLASNQGPTRTDNRGAAPRTCFMPCRSTTEPCKTGLHNDTAKIKAREQGN